MFKINHAGDHSIRRCALNGSGLPTNRVVCDRFLIITGMFYVSAMEF